MCWRGRAAPRAFGRLGALGRLAPSPNSSAISAKGERLTSLLYFICISFQGIFEHFWAPFLTRCRLSMLAVRIRTDAMDLAQNPGHSLRLYLTSSSFSPPAAPCPGLASLWLGRGSGGAPFCFPSVFLPVFPPSLLVRCSSRELRARAKWVPILAQACDSVIGTSRFRIVCAWS